MPYMCTNLNRHWIVLVWKYVWYVGYLRCSALPDGVPLGEQSVFYIIPPDISP